MNFQAEHQFFGRRLHTMLVVSCLIIGVLVTRVWYLQVLKGEYFRDLSENNRTRNIHSIAPRGYIYDREGRALVKNRPSFNIAVMLEDVADIEHTISRLSVITGRDQQQLEKNLAGAKKRQPFEPKVVMRDVSREELAQVKVHAYELPGVIVDVTPTRAYPNDNVGAQLLGYVRQISKEQLKKKRTLGYRLGDLLGQSGIESEWEETLRGEDGRIRVEVDAMGNRKKELGIIEDRAGDDLYLTLDLDLQREAQEALGERKGALVALDPRSGEILAFVSSPSFDANIFAGEMKPENWRKISKNPQKPLNNRALSSKYRPGSTFKLILAIAGLAEKVISTQTQYDCPGYYLFAGRRYHCHKRSGHGKVNLREAITMSCNAYFYQLGQALGIDRIHKYATMFGLGERLRLGLPGESKGIVPSKSWKLKYLGERWYPGETLSVSIGQGFLDVTILQLATAISSIANGGQVFRPMLVKGMFDKDRGQMKEFSPKLLKEADVPDSLLKQVREFAVSVVEDEKGTGKAAAVTGIRVGGKTGTSQVVSLGKEGTSEKNKDHALFVSFAPAESPMIAMAIVVENGGHGGVAAAPISKRIMEIYFKKKGLWTEPEEEGADHMLEARAESSGSELGT